VALYRGELLPGYFEEWIFTERVRLAEAELRAFHQLVGLLEARGEIHAAIQWARRAVGLDLLREESHQELIRLLSTAGELEAARQQYQELERLLARELGVAPSPEIRALVAALPDAPVLAIATSSETPPRGRDGAERQQAGSPEAEPEGSSVEGTPGTRPSSALSRKAEPPATGSLPLQFTRFFGREPDLARVREWLLSPGARLVTLTGPGGTGKTRLALEAAARLREADDGAVWFVPLLDLTDPRLIADQVLLSLRLTRAPQTTALEQVVGFLSRHRALLVLDNFEHLVEGGAETVRVLLGRVESLTILVTSRRGLGLEGERGFPVGPLPVPGVQAFRCSGVQEGAIPPSEYQYARTHERLNALAQCPSVQLFVERAQAVRPDFQVTRTNANAVAALCAGLEGLPLAIELAAARAGVLTPSQMLLHLEQRFELLRGRQRAADPRHRSLRETLDWSYQLLSPEQQQFLARLSVFRGGWTLDAARVVCAQPLALDYLSQLRESSLVIAEEQGEAMRYRMLETIREYAQEALSAGGEVESVRQRLAAYYLAWVEETQTAGPGADAERGFDLVEREHDNLRSVLAWLVETVALPKHGPTPEQGLRFGSMLSRFWRSRGYLQEGREWLRRLLARPWASGRTEGRAELLSMAGQFEESLEDHDAARALGRESLALCRELGYRPGMARALGNLARLSLYLDRDYEMARCQIEEGLSLWRELGDPEGIANALNALGGLAYHLGDLEEAWRVWEEHAAGMRERGDQRGLASSLGNLRLLATYQEDDGAARRLLLECLTIARSLGNKTAIASALGELGSIAYRQGALAMARQYWEESLVAARGQEHQGTLAHLLRCMGQGPRPAATTRRRAPSLTKP
jgi:predicted ATPase